MCGARRSSPWKHPLVPTHGRLVLAGRHKDVSGPATQVLVKSSNSRLSRPPTKPAPFGSRGPHVPAYLVPTPANNTFFQLCLTKPRVKLCDFSKAYIPGLPRLLGLATAHILCAS